ncbi:hypothetical protein LTR62_004584 [Meristemomyces frigidus]|uniref:Phosphoglycerate mutase-like protein n=1 Tax=Meristemomyces frigidus TaxID=1508187 RepID=A0AAN7TQQ6_9PEZI|nr:hypothetical protein LTR62_004584 [Meristemomyces frigidus]
MRLYLIRHGETVDNVAGLYAGVRDSALTNHGIEQARKLGAYFAKTDVKLTHIYASPLQRAFKTAEAVRDTQVAIVNTQSNGEEGGSNAGKLDIIKVPHLIEQDFGFYEGRPFYTRSSDPRKSGREAHHHKHKNDPGFVDVETKESMYGRADNFLDQHLIPLALGQAAGTDKDLIVGVVSHGILLSNLWRRLLLRLPRKSLSIAAEVTAARGPLVLEHLGGWSNTGYLELCITRPDDNLPRSPQPADTKESADVRISVSSTPLPKTPTRSLARNAVGSKVEQISAASTSSPSAPLNPITLAGWSTTIVAVDSKQHLIGLKRQRGGIGRLAHDEGQKKLDFFFKRQKKA